MDDHETHVEIRETEDPDTRLYCLTWEVSNKNKTKRFSYSDNIEDSVRNFEAIGQPGTALVCRIMANRAVSEIYLSQNKLTVVKKPTFNWDVLEFNILEALMESFRQTEKDDPLCVLRVGQNLVLRYA